MSEDIVERLRAPTDDDGDLLQDAADALTAQAARLAECERELQARKNYTDADYVRLHKAHCVTADDLSAACAKLAECEERANRASQLNHYLAQILGVISKERDAATARAEALEKAADAVLSDQTLINVAGWYDSIKQLRAALEEKK
jgi:hypothetical protein